MFKRLGFRVIFIPAVLITQLLTLVGVGMLLRAGTGSLNNSDHLPTAPGLYLILIDTKHYTRKVGKETFKGLPDSHDFSKQKDFFALFPALYCSGKMSGDRHEADYCSTWGEQFFDLQRLWRVWGVDLIKENLVGSTPRLVYAGLLTTVIGVVLSAIFSILAFFSYWSAIAATVLSWVSTIAAISTAALSNTFVNELAFHLNSIKTAGSGKIVAHWGTLYLNSVWICAGLALLASISLTFFSWRERKGRSATKKNDFISQIPLMSAVRRATSGLRGQSSSYKHIEQDMVGGSLANLEKNSPSVLNSRSMSPEPEDIDLYSRGKAFPSDTAYEPMRHRSVE